MSADNGKTWTLTTSRELEVNSISVSAEQPNRVFIGTNNYGVMVSNDGGKNFAPTNGNFSSRLTYTVTPDIEQSNRLYATTINTATGGGFIFVSNDSGRTWAPSMKNLSANVLVPYSLLQDKVNPNTIFMATNQGMYRSIDRGGSWTPLYTAPPAAKGRTVKRKVAAKSTAKAPVRKGKTIAKVTTAAVAAEKTVSPNLVPALLDKVNVLVHTEDGKNGIFAGTNKGLFVSYDPAKGWEKLPFGNGLDERVFAIATSAQNPEAIWVGTAVNGVIVSRDGGKTWEKSVGVPEIIPVSAVVD